MQLPTMMIVGAQKCGTTTLAGALRRHPQIFMARPKELHFFDRHFRQGLDYYRSSFTPGPEHVHAGEATPIYMYDRRARARIAETLPDAKIVAILRDPVKRAYSHFWHERRRGKEPLETFEEALDAEAERLAKRTQNHRSWFSYVDRGRYYEQIRDLEAGHGRDNLHVMLLDDLVADPVTSLGGLLDFLGLDPAGSAELPVEKKNPYRVTDEAGVARAAAYPPINPETRARLVEQLRGANEDLAAWWGRDLSAWNTV